MSRIVNKIGKPSVEQTTGSVLGYNHPIATAAGLFGRL